jgi:hypothetical protein
MFTQTRSLLTATLLLSLARPLTAAEQLATDSVPVGIAVPKTVSASQAATNAPGAVPKPQPKPRLVAFMIQLNDSADPVQVGGGVAYKLEIENRAPAVENVVVSCVLDPKLKFVLGKGASPVKLVEGKLVCAPVASLAKNEKVSWEFRCKAVAAGEAEFKVEILCDGSPKPAVGLEKTEITPAE